MTTSYDHRLCAVTPEADNNLTMRGISDGSVFGSCTPIDSGLQQFFSMQEGDIKHDDPVSMWAADSSSLLSLYPEEVEEFPKMPRFDFASLNATPKQYPGTQPVSSSLTQKLCETDSRNHDLHPTLFFHDEEGHRSDSGSDCDDGAERSVVAQPPVPSQCRATIPGVTVQFYLNQTMQGSESVESFIRNLPRSVSGIYDPKHVSGVGTFNNCATVVFQCPKTKFSVYAQLFSNSKVQLASLPTHDHQQLQAVIDSVIRVFKKTHRNAVANDSRPIFPFPEALQAQHLQFGVKAQVSDIGTDVSLERLATALQGSRGFQALNARDVLVRPAQGRSCPPLCCLVSCEASDEGTAKVQVWHSGTIQVDVSHIFNKDMSAAGKIASQVAMCIVANQGEVSVALNEKSGNQCRRMRREKKRMGLLCKERPNKRART